MFFQNSWTLGVEKLEAYILFHNRYNFQACVFANFVCDVT